MAVKSKPQELQQDGYGFIINFRTEANMASTTSLLVKIRKKGATTLVEHTLDASAIVDAATGSVNFVVIEGDLDTLGDTKIQIIDNTPGRYIPSKVAKFKVVKNV